MRKRVFWSCYCLDRQVSIILGRPFSISDRDVDVELPLDVEEACEDIGILELAREAALQSPDTPTTSSTSMTGFLYILRLRRIESQIQQSIYRVDQSAPATAAKAEKLIEQLELWRKSMPADACSTDPESMIVDGYDNYVSVGLAWQVDCLADNSDGVLLQMSAVPPPSAYTVGSFRHQIPETMRRGLRRGLPYL